jgi:hypothetical protein
MQIDCCSHSNSIIVFEEKIEKKMIARRISNTNTSSDAG